MKKKDNTVTYELTINKTALKDGLLMLGVGALIGVLYDVVLFLPLLLK